MTVKDAKGKPIRVGSYVKIIPERADESNAKDTTRFCKFTKNRIFKVTDVERFSTMKNRISVVHEPTGLINGWYAAYFIVVNQCKSHLPSWW